MKRYCIRKDNFGDYYFVESRNITRFDDWLKWFNKVDKSAEQYSDKFPIGNRESLDPPSYANKIGDIFKMSFTMPKEFVMCGKKLECGSSCIVESGHDGGCLCCGDENCESGTCPA